ncbi:Der GTPase-activating protein YihI [Pectobacterium brasiliense]|uniref:Der GTPase-activating protein YihI n=1 Tax=Pectobacterium brasiliense TaxID=180957 RepID=UPI00057E88C2|nr:Der GTPase-activating protein YihI [Pectobacterium brasiliense]APS32054.1 GTPase activator [Pectobacterium brasiliense]KHT05739.1 GTPase activator [Pectobacterium brasiliense]MBN3098755.1 Der GTPase-activating protein YihI [Pectobacterium brasiliense]MBN3101674.1 Der GTPase-activating protein YihI [Pectobacterium brasiliense]MBN3164378.1 Der GTPase-activating protein YihI [Pectobacterium brasiliense]
MNRPVKWAADKAGKPKVKRKTREELEREARERKKDKKHRGNASGSRTQEKASNDKRSGQRKAVDPRIGSKKPVQLGVLDSAVAKPKPKSKPSEPVEKVVAAKPTMSPEEELEMLENDARLDALLDRLDSGETLSAKDQSWVDETLDRIDILMEELGIELGDDDEEEPQEDMLQLLKRNNPKDTF